MIIIIVIVVIIIIVVVGLLLSVFVWTIRGNDVGASEKTRGACICGDKKL